MKIFIINWIKPFLDFSPLIMGAILLLFITVTTLTNREEERNYSQFYWKAVWIFISFKILYALIATASQYLLWSEHSLSKFLLPPYQSFSYFMGYTYQRIWLEELLAIGTSFLFFLFLKYLRKRNPRFLKEGEEEFGLLASLISGWPGFLIFFPFTFLLTLFNSVRKNLSNKNAYTTLENPILIAAWITFLTAPFLIKLFHLKVFIV